MSWDVIPYEAADGAVPADVLEPVMSSVLEAEQPVQALGRIIAAGRDRRDSAHGRAVCGPRARSRAQFAPGARPSCARENVAQLAARKIDRVRLEFLHDRRPRRTQALDPLLVNLSYSGVIAGPRMNLVCKLVQLAAPAMGRGGRRYRPYAFTEQGVAMLSGVLRSERAVAVNIQIMRAFVELRRMAASHDALERRLDELEREIGAKLGEHDKYLATIFQTLRRLVAPPEQPKRRIGFAPPEET